MSRLLTKFSTRKCRGCDDPSPHDSHLTWIDRLRFVTRALNEGGYVGPHVGAAICFAIGAFCLILLLLGGPNGAWR